MPDIQTPVDGKLIHSGVEVILYAYGELKEDSIHPLSNKHAFTPPKGVDLSPRLTHRLEKHITRIRPELTTTDSIPELIQSVIGSDYIFAIYDTGSEHLIVTPKLRTVYTFKSNTMDDTQFVTTIEESPPMTNTPDYELIGTLSNPEDTTENQYEFNTHGWKMKLKRKHNYTLSLIHKQPELVLQYDELTPG